MGVLMPVVVVLVVVGVIAAVMVVVVVVVMVAVAVERVVVAGFESMRVGARGKLASNRPSLRNSLWCEYGVKLVSEWC
jgi:hypothetical protein